MADAELFAKLGRPLAWARRASLSETVPVPMTLLVPGLATDAWATIEPLAAGYAVFPAQVPMPGARRSRRNRQLVWTASERRRLKRAQSDNIVVALERGLFICAQDRLPPHIPLDAMPEITPRVFAHGGKETAWGTLAPVNPHGLQLSREAARHLGIDPGTPLFLEHRKDCRGGDAVVLTAQNRGGEPVAAWRDNGLWLEANWLKPVMDGHTMQVTGIPGFGWLVQGTTRSGRPMQMALARMPDLSHERVLGKLARKVGVQRETIRFVDLPSACLYRAGFAQGDRLAVTRLPEGGIRIARDDRARQVIRATKAHNQAIAFRIGETELNWLQALSDVQVITCKGAIYVLPAEVGNTIPPLERVEWSKEPVTLPYSPDDEICVPAEVLAGTEFKPGARYAVQILRHRTEITLAEDGPWQVSGEPNAPELRLPPEMAHFIEGSQVVARLKAPDSLTLAAG